MNLLHYLFKRISYGLVVIWIVMTLVFVGIRAIPGGPANTILGDNAPEEAVAALQAELGLNRPIYVQYVDWITDLLQFELGNSMRSSQSVSEMIMLAGPRSLSIALVAITVGLAIALPAGVISAVYKDKPIDYGATIVAFFGLSLPAFFVGILLALMFGVWLDWLPVFGYTSIQEGVLPWLKGILLPGISVGIAYTAIIMRMMRSSLLEELGSPYIKTARAKGVRPKVRLYKHAIPEALIPVVTVAGIQLALIVTGSVTVELVFGIQGIGRLFVETIISQDYTVTQVVIVLIAAFLIGVNIIMDLVYVLINPRIRYGGEN
jgi:peptide/nickel transport system permease protein